MLPEISSPNNKSIKLVQKVDFSQLTLTGQMKTRKMATITVNDLSESPSTSMTQISKHLQITPNCSTRRNSSAFKFTDAIYKTETSTKSPKK